jgi:hypothetical protein
MQSQTIATAAFLLCTAVAAPVMAEGVGSIGEQVAEGLALARMTEARAKLCHNIGKSAEDTFEARMDGVPRQLVQVLVENELVAPSIVQILVTDVYENYAIVPDDDVERFANLYMQIKKHSKVRLAEV